MLTNWASLQKEKPLELTLTYCRRKNGDMSGGGLAG